MPLLKVCPHVQEDHVRTVLQSPPHRLNGPLPDEQHGAVLAYADAMTLDVNVPEEVFKNLKSKFTDKEVVEITATIAAYNCVSRVLVALDVGERNGQGVPDI
jgi:alkylhydroperoxidase family enzyme